MDSILFYESFINLLSILQFEGQRTNSKFEVNFYLHISLDSLYTQNPGVSFLFIWPISHEYVYILLIEEKVQ